MRILVADDDAVIRKMLSSLLTEKGYEVTTCSDGRDAWNVLQTRNTPRIALLDWMMPEMDGLEVCRKLRSSRRDTYVYVIMFTQRSAREDLLEALDAGADDYLIKPVDRKELFVRVKAGRRVVELQSELLAANAVLETVNEELREALARVEKLSAVLPICPSCRRIRDDRGAWRSIEDYLGALGREQVSHDLCPECRSARGTDPD